MSSHKPRYILFASFLLFLSQASILSAQETVIYFEYPSNEGDFYVSGNLTFGPGCVPTEKNIAIIEKASGRETASRVKTGRRWPDGSILNAEVSFAANRNDKKDYVARSGEEVSRKKIISEAAVLPAVLFSTEGAPFTAEKMNMPVGTINVRLDKSSELYYYWHIIPITLIILLTILRSRKRNETI